MEGAIILAILKEICSILLMFFAPGYFPSITLADRFKNVAPAAWQAACACPTSFKTLQDYYSLHSALRVNKILGLDLMGFFLDDIYNPASYTSSIWCSRKRFLNATRWACYSQNHLFGNWPSELSGSQQFWFPKRNVCWSLLQRVSYVLCLLQ